jgi:hypothetical protein
VRSTSRAPTPFAPCTTRTCAFPVAAGEVWSSSTWSSGRPRDGESTNAAVCAVPPGTSTDTSIAGRLSAAAPAGRAVIVYVPAGRVR